LGIRPSQGRNLHTEQHRHRINAHRLPCLEWDRTTITAFEREKTKCLRPRDHIDLYARIRIFKCNFQLFTKNRSFKNILYSFESWPHVLQKPSNCRFKVILKTISFCPWYDRNHHNRQKYIYRCISTLGSNTCLQLFCNL
jgi:hypothetical protein